MSYKIDLKKIVFIFIILFTITGCQSSEEKLAGSYVTEDGGRLELFSNGTFESYNVDLCDDEYFGFNNGRWAIEEAGGIIFVGKSTHYDRASYKLDGNELTIYDRMSYGNELTILRFSKNNNIDLSDFEADDYYESSNSSNNDYFKISDVNNDEILTANDAAFILQKALNSSFEITADM